MRMRSIFAERVFRQNDLTSPSFQGYINTPLCVRRKTGLLSKKGALCFLILGPYLECQRHRFPIPRACVCVGYRTLDIAINRTQDYKPNHLWISTQWDKVPRSSYPVRERRLMSFLELSTRKHNPEHAQHTETKSPAKQKPRVALGAAGSLL